MANASDNYGLILPVDGEFIEINDLNYNFEKIDNVMWDNRRISVAMYNTARTYNTGSLAGHEDANGHIHAYRCLADNVTGTWDATKWTLTDLASEIEDIRENAGTDVEANPSGTATDTLEKLRVEDTIYEIPPVSKEAEGNPIEITDGASAPLVKCVTEIQGSQDLHGYDKPWVGGAGKNKFDAIGNTSTKAENGVNITMNSDGTVLVNGTATSVSQIYWTIPRDTARTYAGMILNGNIQQSGVILGLELASSPYTIFASDTGSDSTISEEIASATASVNLILRISTNVTLNNALIKPMIRLSTETDPTFAPYSNICPITAYTEGEIEVRGKNLFDKSEAEVNSLLDSTTGALISNIDQNYRYGVSGYIGVKSNTSYHIPATGSGRCFFFDKNKTMVENIANVSTGTNYTPNNDGYIRLSFATTDNNINAFIDAYQIEKGSSATTYEPYTSTTHTTTFPSAIYRGSEDCVKGEVTADGDGEMWIVKDLGDYTWGKGGTDRFFTTESLAEHPSVASEIGKIISEWYKTESASDAYARIDGVAIGDSGGVPQIYVYDSTKSSMTAEQFKTAITGCKIAFSLADKTPISVTPTNLPIKSLSGYSHIESSTGDMEIEYITSKYQPLINLMKNMVVANPSEDATATLEKLKVNDTVYSLPSGGGGGNTVLAQSLNTLTVTEV